MTHATHQHRSERTAAARRSARHARVQHLVTADENSLADLEALLATLPMCSTGRVFIEVPDATWVGEVTAPSRMSVSWLDRSRRSGAPGSSRSCAAGEALTRAATAWADEMLCVEDDCTQIHLLGGYLSTADIVDHLVDLGIRSETVHTPAAYGLSTAR